MTAVIGILNKNAIAIAADSAVTVSGSNGRKIYNTANKIFTLSKFEPVSIIVYSSANFISTPWEIIIKIYRNELGKKSFPHLKDYSEDFFQFLKEKNFFATEETISHYIKSLIFSAFESMKQHSLDECFESEADLISLTPEQRIELFRKTLIKVIDDEIEEMKEEEQLADFKSLTKKRFREIIKSDVYEIIEEDFPEFDTPEIKKIFLSMLFYYYKSKSFRSQWSGLVFAGYGMDEIFPNAISTKVSDVFDGKLRFHTEGIEEIDDGNDGSIMPFAQRDVIDTLITGVSPEINQTLFSTFNKFLSGYNNHIISILEKTNPELSKKLREIDIDNICQQLLHEIDEVKEVKHIRPTVNTVSILSKEDLAEMAESLIYLTYLKRRISSDEESVGGPVDVALISKGDGFIWIKRKHYFEEKYNPQFNKNYFNT